MRTNSNAFSSLKLCHILSKYKWIHVISIFLLLIKKKRNILNRGQEIPKLAAAIAEMISIHLLRRAVPCHHFSLEQVLWSDHGLLSPAGPVSLLGPTNLSLDPLLCSIQSPFTSFLCLPLYMNFSVLSAITSR